jgi:hypothetical protein
VAEVRSVPDMLDSPSPRALPAANRSLALLAGAAVLSGATAAILIARHRLWAGVAAGPGAVALVVASVQWRIHGGRRARFSYLVLDLAFDTCILAPIAWVERLLEPRVAVLALIGLGASYVASYERARGNSLGYQGAEELPYRTARAALLVLGLLTGWIEPTLWVFVALTGLAAGLRAWSVAGQHRESVRQGGPT